MSEIQTQIEQEVVTEGSQGFLGTLLGNLCHAGVLTSEHQETALELIQERQLGVLDALRSIKGVSETAVLDFTAKELSCDFLKKIDQKSIDDGLISRVPINFAKQNKILPIRADETGLVMAVTANPYLSHAVDDLSMLLNAPVLLDLSTSEEVIQAINVAYDRGTAHAAAAMEEMADDDINTFALEIEEAVDLLDSEDQAPIIRLVNSLISQAVKEHASDIHIEPGERVLSVRFRIDGILYDKIKPPKKLHASIVSRIKIQAELNIAEKRLPQDGRIRLKIAGRDIDVRVATAPTAYGERITMRLLDRSSVLMGLGDLGFSPDNLKGMDGLIHKSHGIILVTGPTGSGKTTTLYAALSAINSPDLNILTIEDPVEYQLDGISQTQVQANINLTFSSGLRSFLRHDPDVIMVGEIRDLETAEIAIQAALTGHLVLSTAHTNDAAGAFTRLADMGVEPFLVASSVVGILAQRLLRTLCKHCKESYAASDEELEQLGLSREVLGPEVSFWKGEGCSHCFNTGYQGRLSIHELLIPTDEIRQLILQNVDAGTIKTAAKKYGMRSLREDGAQKVLAGITSSAEVLRVTAED